MTMDQVDVTAIIVNYNTRELLAPCVDALRAGAGALRLQIIIVDNGSRDGSQDLLRSEFGACEVIFNVENVGFGRAVNQGARVAKGEYLLILNPDVVPEAGALERVSTPRGRRSARPR